MLTEIALFTTSVIIHTMKWESAWQSSRAHLSDVNIGGFQFGVWVRSLSVLEKGRRQGEKALPSFAIKIKRLTVGGVTRYCQRQLAFRSEQVL